MRRSLVRRAVAAAALVVSAVVVAVVPAQADVQPPSRFLPKWKPTGQELVFYQQRDSGATVTERLLETGWVTHPRDRPVHCSYLQGQTYDEPATFKDGWWTVNGRAYDESESYGYTSHFGRDGDVPLCGRLQQQRYHFTEHDSLVVWRNGVFYFQDNVGGVTAVSFGKPTDTPLLGDWDDDDVDEMAVKRGNQYFFATANVPGGGGVRTSTFGQASDVPVPATDVYLQGYDTLALRRGNAFFFTTDMPGTPVMRETSQRVYGRTTDVPLSVTARLSGVPDEWNVAVARVQPIPAATRR